MDKFLKLFEGMELTPEFQKELTAVFNDAVDGKVKQLVNEEETPKMCESCKTKQKYLKNGEEMTWCEACQKTMVKEAEGEEEVSEAPADGEKKELEKMDPDEIIKDPDMRRILTALKVNPVAFARSLKAATVDIKGNMVGDDAFNDLLIILDALAQDSNLASRLALQLKNKEKDTPADGEEEVDAELKTEAADEVDPELEKDEKDDDDEIEAITEALMQNIDRYLSYAATTWLEENKLAVENGLKTELVESFIGGLKTLFTEHNMEVPETVSVVEKLNKKIEKLTEDLNAAVNTTITLKEELDVEKVRADSVILAEKVQNAFAKSTTGLPTTTIEKLKKMTETITYTTVEDFEEKLTVLKESVASEKKSGKKVLNEEDLNNEQPENKKETNEIADPILKLYSDAISQNLKF